MRILVVLPFFLSLSNFVLDSYAAGSVEVMRMEDFPVYGRGRIALHFPCKESNMFATNCACHLRCLNSRCQNAVDLCKKYEQSLGCKYVLVRGGAKNKIATLKRSPSTDELTRFQIDDFADLTKFRNVPPRPTTTLSGLLRIAGPRGRKIFEDISGTSYSLRASKSNFCPRNTSTGLDIGRLNDRDKFLKSGIALVAISYRSPLTFANSVRSWNASGLLDMMHSRTAILSHPDPRELGVAKAYGIPVLQPQEIPNVRMAKPNVLTIGAAFYYALKYSSIDSEYVLFLENDFKMDTALSLAQVSTQLLAATALLERGAQVVRLLSRKTKGCGTFKDCDHGGIHLDATNPVARARNWFAFYCRERTDANAYVDDCAGAINTASQSEDTASSSSSSEKEESSSSSLFRCFTSGDSNWSLNAVIVKRSSMLGTKYKTANGEMKSIAEIGLSHFIKQDGFESDMMYESRWMTWRVPICISYSGLFIHEEIETAS